MSALTAAEWNERYPQGTPIGIFVELTLSFEGDNTRGPAAETGAGPGVLTYQHGFAALAEIEPLASDDQRRGDGWLDPTQADQLRAERDEALRVIRNAHQAIRTQTTAAAVALAMFATAENGVPSLLDELKQLRALTASCSCGTSPMTYEGPEPDCPVHGAVRALNQAMAERAVWLPIIDAARALIREVKAARASKARSDIAIAADALGPLLAAVDALDRGVPDQ